MPNFDLAKQPRYPVKTIDTDKPLTEKQLLDLLEQTPGITLCIRTLSGHANRGGHFFCIQKSKDGGILLETMEQVFIDSFSVPTMMRFINHVCGLQFDREMQLYCQNSVNFRTD